MSQVMSTYRVRVLGCRVNHAERRELEAVLRSRGLHEATPGMAADLEVVHTCGVTGRAAAKSRQAIRRASRGQSPRGAVLVTGCLVGINPAEAHALAGPTGAALGHQVLLPDALGGWIDERIAHSQPRDSAAAAPDTCDTPATIPLPLTILPDAPARHVRAEVRIQDGCDAHCTFCIIPKGRPVLRTKRISVVLDEVARLVDLGHPEIVLAGIFLGAYGHETALRRRQHRPMASPLADLVDAVASTPGLQRLRLSSLEPGDVTKPLLDAYQANARVMAPHLHLPLQSGSDTILRRMNRQYCVGEYHDMIDRVTSVLTARGLPPAITTDIICGFPGESPVDFGQTLAVARSVGFLHMHVFPFSPRAGTAAARWTHQAIPPPIAHARVRQLIDLETTSGTGLADTFRSRLVGREVRLFAEKPDARHAGRWTGRCDHYAEVSVPGPRRRGELARAIVRGIEDDVLVADPVPADVRLPVLDHC